MSSAYKEKLKDTTDNFKENARSVQQMISDMEGEIFSLLKQKEKLREKIIATREEKRLAPSMKERSEILVDELSDFANLYNLRQPKESKVTGVEIQNVGDRPVLGEGPKLTRTIVVEMNPAEVADQSSTTPSQSTSPAALSPKNGADFETASQASSQALSAGGHNIQPLEQPSVALSFGFGFKSLKLPHVPLGCHHAIKVRPPKNAPAPPIPSPSPTMISPVIEIDHDETPILALRFSLVVPTAIGSDLESIRLSLQSKLDVQIEEMKSSIEKAKTSFDEAVDEAEKENDGDDKEKKSNAADEKKQDDDVDLDEVSELLWKSLRLVAGVTKNTTAHGNPSSTVLNITIYVYRILTEEQKQKQAKLADKVEAKINNVVHEAGVNDDDIKKEAKEFSDSRTARQLSAICRLIADCNFSALAELQITASQPPSIPSDKNKSSENNNNNNASSTEALDETQKPSTVANNNTRNSTNSNKNNNSNSLESKATDIMSRILDSAPRIEKAIKEAAKNFSGDSLLKKALTSPSDGDKNKNDDDNDHEKPSTPEQELAEAKKKAVDQALAFYKDSILPAVQRNIDPEDKVTKLINQLVGENVYNPAKEALTNLQQQQQQQPPFAISLNGHHAELNNLPKQLVRQTANMIYDYFLDTTESLSGRAYIGMSRRRTLAGVALYDALHFNIVPLQQNGKTETAKSACAFYHSEKVLRDSLVRLVEKAVEQAIDAKGKMSKAVDDEKSEEGKKLNETVEKAQATAMKLIPSLDGVNKDSIISTTLSTLKLGVKIGKNLLSKFKSSASSSNENNENDDDDITESSSSPANSPSSATNTAFSFIHGQVCCCEPSRPLEVDIYMPDSKAVCTFRVVLRPARPEHQSPRIKARRKDAKSPAVAHAQATAQQCTGYCSAALPEFGLQVGEAFANLWLDQIEDLVDDEEKEGASK